MIVCSTRPRTRVRNSLLAMALLAILTPFNLVHAQKPGGEDPRVAKYQTIEREIKAAVNDGRLTAAEGKKKLAATRAMIFGKAKAKVKPNGEGSGAKKYRAMERDIRAAVEAGKITAAEAERKLTELRKKLLN